MATPWDAEVYDRASDPQRAWALGVLERLGPIAADATVLDVGCGTGRVTEELLALFPRGRVLALDASPEMVALARARLGERAQVWCQDVLELDLECELDAIVSTAALHWVRDHERMWARLARALRPGGRLEAQCGGEGNIARVREAIDAVVREHEPDLVGFSPWTFDSPAQAERQLLAAGFSSARCWLQDMPTRPDDVGEFVTSSILPAHLERLPQDRRARFAKLVLERVRLPLDYVRLNVSAVR